MSLAFVLLQCDERSEKNILDEIKSINEVKETHQTFGPYDAVVKIESASPNLVKQIFREKIQKIQGVRSTLTLIGDTV